MAKGDGMAACEAALERLISGKPKVPEHAGLGCEKITAGIVSVEAGFDRGYLKKSRNSHKPLIARIESIREDQKGPAVGHRELLKRARQKAAAAEKDKSGMKIRLDIVLTQNLMLVERIRQLELKLRAAENVVPIKK